MRSRWLGSMLAWILNTKPLTLSSVGCTWRLSVGCGRGGGAMSATPCSSSRTPKLFSADPKRSEEHTSELQSLMRISYAVFCLKKKKKTRHETKRNSQRPHNTNDKSNKHIL